MNKMAYYRKLLHKGMSLPLVTDYKQPEHEKPVLNKWN